MAHAKMPPCAGVAQLVRAPACHARGRGFEPRHSRHSPPDRVTMLLDAALALRPSIMADLRHFSPKFTVYARACPGARRRCVSDIVKRRNDSTTQRLVGRVWAVRGRSRWVPYIK